MDLSSADDVSESSITTLTREISRCNCSVLACPNVVTFESVGRKRDHRTLKTGTQAHLSIVILVIRGLILRWYCNFRPQLRLNSFSGKRQLPGGSFPVRFQLLLIASYFSNFHQ
jgi:hypothetical protein